MAGRATEEVMTDEQKGHLQALSDVRSWHRRQVNQRLGEVRTM